MIYKLNGRQDNFQMYYYHNIKVSRQRSYYLKANNNKIQYYRISSLLHWDQNRFYKQNDILNMIKQHHLHIKKHYCRRCMYDRCHYNNKSNYHTTYSQYQLFPSKLSILNDNFYMIKQYHHRIFLYCRLHNYLQLINMNKYYCTKNRYQFLYHCKFNNSFHKPNKTNQYHCRINITGRQRIRL